MHSQGLSTKYNVLDAGRYQKDVLLGKETGNTQNKKSSYC